MRKSKKIETALVIRTSAMGDVAMTVPVIEQFKLQNPGVKLVVLTSPAFVPFFRYLDNITVEVCELHGRHEGIRGIYRLYKELSSKYRFDSILDLQVKLYSRLLKMFFGFRRVPIYMLDKGKKEKNQVTRQKNKNKVQLQKMVFRYASVFKAAGLNFDFLETPYLRRMEPMPEKYSFLEGERLIGFSPLASFEGKQLPLKIVRSLTEQLIERFPQYKIVVFGGGRYEKMVGDSLESFYPGFVYSTIGKMNIPLEMDLMSNLDIMISMDSSAQHICALLGVKVLSVWGATHPYTGFLGYSHTMEKNAITLDLDCSPCSVYGDKPCYRGNRPCMYGLTAEIIADRVAKALEN